MDWERIFIASSGVLVILAFLSPILGKIKYKKKRIINPFHILLAAVFISAAIMYFPMYYELFKEEELQGLKSILLSIFSSLRVFLVDGEYNFVSEHIAGLSGWVYTAYSVHATFLFVAGPLLTFGVVLSFFKNLQAYKRYFTGFFRETYIFSQLNEGSLLLAEGIKSEKRRPLIIFTDVSESEEKDRLSDFEKAEQLGAICFRKDIASIRFGFHCPGRKLNFFMVEEADDKNIKYALELIGRYKKRRETEVYVFSESIMSQMLLSGAKWGKVTVHRVDRIQSLISRTLYDTGYETIFKHAADTANKNICAVIVGLGKHGMEMLKALPWFCQMDVYSAQLHAFDSRSDIEGEFMRVCPELMKMQNKVSIGDPEDAHYSITLHQGVNTNSHDFFSELSKLGNITYIFIAQGSDEQNIRTAVEIRAFLGRRGVNPKIQTVIYNSDLKEEFSHLKNQGISIVGDLRSSYSPDVVMNSKLVDLALERHKKWGGDEESFWKSEYNYRSSTASVIHKKMKIACGIPGANIDDPQKRNPIDRVNLRMLEHRRWNAYMRSEGYVYDKKKDHTLKTHYDLVRFSKLDPKTQENDDF